MSGFSTRQLGKTGLKVSPIGIGTGNGLPAEDLLYAFEKGINYFFYSSDLHHATYSRAAPALRKLCARGSSVRDQIVLATVSYLDDPDKLRAAVLDQFYELDIDYIDVFHWGWITEDTDVFSLLQCAQQLKAGGKHVQSYREFMTMVQRAEYISKDLLKQGLARYVGMSFHSRRAALKVMNDIDVMMLRYNIALTGAEDMVFSQLSGDKNTDPGIVVFTTAHEGWKFFHIPPPRYPVGLYVPSIPDCYRFALSNPWVDVALTGVTNREEIDQALEGVEKGPLDPEDYEFLREYGSLFARR